MVNHVVQLALEGVCASWIGGSFQKTLWDDEQRAHAETNDNESPNRKLGIPVANGKDSQPEDDGGQDHVPPRDQVRRLSIRTAEILTNPVLRDKRSSCAYAHLHLPLASL